MSNCKPNEKLKTDECLPEELAIESSGKHFYRFGFSLHSHGWSGRADIYHPLAVFVVPFILTARFLYSTLTPPDDDKWFHLLIGDFGYFMKLKFHLNLTAFTVYLVAIISQSILLFDYLRGRPQTWIRVFRVMCGELSPQSVGLTDPDTIKKILAKARLAFKLNQLFRWYITFLAIFISFFAYVFTLSKAEFLLLGLPHTVFFGLGSHYIYTTITTQLFYFYVITYYLKAKQRKVNDRLARMVARKRKINFWILKQTIENISRRLSQVYIEIKEYDSNYWSKYLALIWVTSTTMISLVIFMFIFGQEINMFVRMILFFAQFFFLSLLLIVIETASSVSLQVNRTYKLLANYKALCLEAKATDIRASARYCLKFLNIFERIGMKKGEKIGFSCFKLFVINYFRGTEVLGLCVCVFLRFSGMEIMRRKKGYEALTAKLYQSVNTN